MTYQTPAGRSLCLRGEWIEIKDKVDRFDYDESLCLRGEWIEIDPAAAPDPAAARLSACAESGLKSYNTIVPQSNT